MIGQVPPLRVLILLLTCVVVPTVAATSDTRKLAMVPALGVTAIGETQIGLVHYILIQLEEQSQADGPTILFSETIRGSAVGEEWKDGVRSAVVAAARFLQADPRNWTVTIRNRSNSAFTDGASASSAVALGLIAAWRGDRLRSDVALTGRIMPDGRIREVGALPVKLDAAARAKMHVVLVPRGQAQTGEWNLLEQGQGQGMTVVEVGTIDEAYDWMIETGR